MGYVDILNDYKGDLPKERQWWPDYFYHFTDVHNAVSIIESGWIYSRTQAQAKDIMVNDNASRVVIDMTGDEKKTYGRLYFRPLTPTQYHNEGYKPEFIVVAGHGLIQERNIHTGEMVEFEVSGDKIEAIHMIPGWTHNIINLSETENLVTVMTCNEIFNPERPDTFFEPV